MNRLADSQALVEAMRMTPGEVAAALV